MIGWIVIGIILYFLLGFIYAIITLLCITEEDSKNGINEFDSGGDRLIFILVCNIFWIILIPIAIIYRIYYKIKGGNNNE